MKPIDLDRFPNSTGWHVRQRESDTMYEIVNNKGQRKLCGVFTQRVHAERFLEKYLEDVGKPAVSGRPKVAADNQRSNPPITQT